MILHVVNLCSLFLSFSRSLLLCPSISSWWEARDQAQETGVFLRPAPRSPCHREARHTWSKSSLIMLYWIIMSLFHILTFFVLFKEVFHLLVRVQQSWIYAVEVWCHTSSHTQISSELVYALSVYTCIFHRAYTGLRHNAKEHEPNLRVCCDSGVAHFVLAGSDVMTSTAYT